MKPLDKEQQKNYWKIGLGFVGLLVFIWFVMCCMYFFQQDNVNVAKEVEAELAAVYTDDTKTMVNPAINTDTLNRLINKTNQLKAYRTRAIRSEVREVVKKYQDISLLNNLLNVPIIEPKVLIEQDFTKYKINASKEQIQQTKAKRQYTHDDRFKQIIDAAFNRVETIVNQFEEYQRLVQELTVEVEDISKINQITENLIKIESAQKLAQQHLGAKKITEQLNEKVTKIVDKIKLMNDEAPLKDAEIETLFSSSSIAEQLSGHELDPRLLAALTFDDGPNMEFTPQVLDVLKEYHVKATFFVMGAYVDQYPEMAKRIVEEGHIIANHTYNHPNLADSTDEEVIQQIEWTQESIRDVTGAEAYMFRMPFGAGGKRVVDLAQGLTSIIWNIDTLDWQSHDVDSIVERTLSGLQKNSLILMHDTHQATPDALKIIIPELLKRGYTFVDPLHVGFDYHFFAHETNE